MSEIHGAFEDRKQRIINHTKKESIRTIMLSNTICIEGNYTCVCNQAKFYSNHVMIKLFIVQDLFGFSVLRTFSHRVAPCSEL